MSTTQPADRTKFWRMAVRTSTEGDSTRIVPALDPEWDDLRKLAWKAGVVHASTGLEASVSDATLSINGTRIGGVFDVKVGRTLHGACSYSSAWDLLTGVETGKREASR